jgi:hypothetical protein
MDTEHDNELYMDSNNKYILNLHTMMDPGREVKTLVYAFVIEIIF